MSQADGKLTLRDADNQEHVFDDEDIEAQKMSTLSLMPTDLTANLNQTEFVDLAAFLAELGKDGPFKISSELFVRRWNLPTGQAVYSQVDGSLPLSEVKQRRCFHVRSRSRSLEQSGFMSRTQTDCELH